MVEWICLIAALIRAIGFTDAFTSSAIRDYLNSQLTAYDFVDSKWTIAKRSIGVESKTVQFFAFNRTFRLVLFPTVPEPVGSNVQVSVLGANQSIKSDSAFSTDIVTDYYSGYVDGEPNSKVSGYFAGNLLLCTIHYGNGEVLNVEPMSTITGNQSETKLLVYYDSQLKLSQFASMTSDNEDQQPSTLETHLHSANYKDRGKRAVVNNSYDQKAGQTVNSTKLTCSLQMVADYSFFKRLGLHQASTTMRVIVKIVDEVNDVYYATEWPKTNSKDEMLPFRFGFKISSVVIHSALDSAKGHYNTQIIHKNLYSALETLAAFEDKARIKLGFSKYCLNHLLTYRRMKRNVLGLARVAVPCLHGNSGLTTHCQDNGFPLLFRQAVLVTAHELGHNMGSFHDPATTILCTPETSEGGPYLMRPMSVMGFDTNNYKFSPCSRLAMSPILERAERTKCLKEPKVQICGNHVRESGEECDSGPDGDACCHGNCSLRSSANCSDTNSLCCSDCQIAVKGATCLPESRLRPCQLPSRCDGVSPECPASSAAPDGTVCNSGIGRCSAGSCQSVCHPSLDCSCPNAKDSCTVCCRGDGGSSCTPFKNASSDGAPLLLPVDWPCHSNRDSVRAGRRCLSNGQCEAKILTGSASDDWTNGGTSSRGHERVVNSDPTPNGKPGSRLLSLSVERSGGNFASNNIVFITLIVTLLLYVPASLIFHYRTEQLRAATDGADNAGDDNIAFDVTHSNA